MHDSTLQSSNPEARKLFLDALYLLLQQMRICWWWYRRLFLSVSTQIKTADNFNAMLRLAKCSRMENQGHMKLAFCKIALFRQQDKNGLFLVLVKMNCANSNVGRYRSIKGIVIKLMGNSRDAHEVLIYTFRCQQIWTAGAWQCCSRNMG